MKSLHWSTFRLFETQNVTFPLFDFSTVRSSKLNLCTFRLFEIQNVTFPLFDFLTLWNSKRNLRTFRLFVFRLFKIQNEAFPLFYFSKFKIKSLHFSTFQRFEIQHAVRSYAMSRHQQSMKHQLNLNKNTTATTILPLILNQTMKWKFASNDTQKPSLKKHQQQP